MVLDVIQFINSPVSSNCFLVYKRDGNKSCIIIDPGTAEEKDLIDTVHSLNLIPEYIILTHEHFDHCWGVNKLRSLYKVKVVCSKNCSERIQNNKKNLSLFYDQKGFNIAEADEFVEGGANLVWNNIMIDIISTKGHTDSSISIIICNCIFTGDSLIKGQRTITKLLTGSKEEQKKTDQYFESLVGKHFKIYPGHGEIFDLDSYKILKYD